MQLEQQAGAQPPTSSLTHCSVLQMTPLHSHSMCTAQSLGTSPAREENSYDKQLKEIRIHKEKELLTSVFFLPYLGHAYGCLDELSSQ